MIAKLEGKYKSSFYKALSLASSSSLLKRPNKSRQNPALKLLWEQVDRKQPKLTG
jgi:hypothetical protein